jgi:hypothetical protein
LVGNLKRKWPRHRWEGNIKDVKAKEYKALDSKRVSHVNTAMNVGIA